MSPLLLHLGLLVCFLLNGLSVQSMEFIKDLVSVRQTVASSLFTLVSNGMYAQRAAYCAGTHSTKLFHFIRNFLRLMHLSLWLTPPTHIFAHITL